MAIRCCYKCEKRTATCHTTCEEYLKQYEANKAEREAKYNSSSINGYAREQATRIEKRRLRKKGFSRKKRPK